LTEEETYEQRRLPLYNARLTVRQKLAIALASAVLTARGRPAFFVVLRLRSAIAAVDHTNMAMRRLDGFLGGMVDAETGQRGPHHYRRQRISGALSQWPGRG
jgi:hypothetical protein